eukprot:gene4126-4372_t
MNALARAKLCLSAFIGGGRKQQQMPLSRDQVAHFTRTTGSLLHCQPWHLQGNPHGNRMMPKKQRWAQNFEILKAAEMQAPHSAERQQVDASIQTEAAEPADSDVPPAAVLAPTPPQAAPPPPAPPLPPSPAPSAAPQPPPLPPLMSADNPARAAPLAPPLPGAAPKGPPQPPPPLPTTAAGPGQAPPTAAPLPGAASGGPRGPPPPLPGPRGPPPPLPGGVKAPPPPPGAPPLGPTAAKALFPAEAHRVVLNTYHHDAPNRQLQEASAFGAGQDLVHKQFHFMVEELAKAGALAEIMNTHFAKKVPVKEMPSEAKQKSILDEKRKIKLELGIRFGDLEPFDLKTKMQLVELHDPVVQLQVLESLQLVMPRDNDVELLRAAQQKGQQLSASEQVLLGMHELELAAPGLFSRIKQMAVLAKMPDRLDELQVVCKAYKTFRQQLLASKPLKMFMASALALVCWANKDMPRLAGSRVLNLPGLLHLTTYRSTQEGCRTNLMEIACCYLVKQLLAEQPDPDQVEVVAASVPALFDGVMVTKAMMNLLEVPPLLDEMEAQLNGAEEVAGAKPTAAAEVASDEAAAYAAASSRGAARMHQVIELRRATINQVRKMVTAAEEDFKDVLSFFSLPTKKLPKAAEFWSSVQKLLGAVKAGQQQELDNRRRQLAREARETQKAAEAQKLAVTQIKAVDQDSEELACPGTPVKSR